MPGYPNDLQDFFSASERLLCRTPLVRLSDDEGILVNYYINELSGRYGAPNEDRDGSTYTPSTDSELLPKELPS